MFTSFTTKKLVEIFNYVWLREMALYWSSLDPTLHVLSTSCACTALVPHCSGVASVPPFIRDFCKSRKEFLASTPQV